MTEQRINTDELKRFIAGREFELAKRILGLADGTNSGEHHQQCPVCEPQGYVGNGTPPFYFRKDSGLFFCRKCKATGGWDVIALVMDVRAVDFKEAIRLIAEASGFHDSSTPAAHKKAVATVQIGNKEFVKGTTHETEYIYTDDTGNPVHKIVRTDGTLVKTGERDKAIQQQRWENKKWVWKKPETTFPYRLSLVLEADTVFIVEGEKTADGLNGTLQTSEKNNGTVATTSPGGVPGKGQWKEYAQRFPVLTEKKIRILPDNNDVGREYAHAVAYAILEANPEADVKFIELPGLPDGGDFVDFMEKHGHADSLSILTELERFAKTETLESVNQRIAELKKRPETKKPATSKQKPEKKIIGGCFADVKDEPIDWLWRGRFAKGHLQQIHGDPDSGKGYFTFWLASIVSRGSTFPNGEWCKKGSVLIVGTEEHAGYARRKLQAQNANLKNVHYITGYSEGDSELPILLLNIDMIQAACDRLAKQGLPVALIIVDPIVQMLGVDPNDNGKVQIALAPVKEFAERNNICFLCVNHDGKGQQATAANRALGATGLMGKMRIGYTAKKELKTSEENEYPHHTIAASKFNIGRRPKGITFRIVEHPDDSEIGKVEILDIEGDFTADDRAGQEGNKFDQCCQWLLSTVPSEGKDKDDVIAEGKSQGFGFHMIYGAFKTLNGESKKQFSGKAKWFLSNHYTPAVTIGESANHYTTTVTIGSPYENKGETALFDEKTSNRYSTQSSCHDWEKNADSAPGVIEGFGDYQNPEPARSESVLAPVPRRCPECRHHVPENYPGGLCTAGATQMDYPCHDYEEIAKTEITAS